MITASSFPILYEQGFVSPTNDCFVPDATPPVGALPLPAPGRPVHHHPDLRWLPLAGQYGVAFVPSFSQVAVLGHAAYALLAGYQQPAPLPPPDDERYEALALSYRLGLLTDGRPRPLTPPDSLVAWMHVTNACNLRCTYCYVEKSDEPMSAATARAAVDATLRSAMANGYRRVHLKYAGGEASLNLPLVELAHRYALAAGAACGVTVTGGVLSNGTALTGPRLRQIADLGLDLMVSLDGPAHTQDRQRPLRNGGGSFRAASAGVERALAHGLRPAIAITVTGASVGGLPELMGWILDRELPFTLNFQRAGSPGASAPHYDEQRLIEGLRAAYTLIAERPPRFSLLAALLDRASLGAPHGRPCGAGENYLVISQRGAIAACQMELEHPVTTIAAPDPLALIRADQVSVRFPTVEDKADCRSCEWRYWCAGGCPVATLRATGRADVRSPNCAVYRALFPDVLRLEGLRLLHYHLDGAPI